MSVVVVGGGVAGLFCAYFLRQAGRDVAVVDRVPVGDPRSCSGGNTGFVGTQGVAPLSEVDLVVTVPPQGEWLANLRRTAGVSPALLELKKRSLAILRGLCDTGGMAAAFEARGMVVAYRTRQAFAKACEALPRMVSHGVPLRVMRRDELDGWAPQVDGALFNEEGAFVRVPDFLHELARTLIGLGVEFHTDAEVTGFDGIGERVTMVRTTRGDWRTDEVVVAAGAWSADLARMLGVELLLEPVKGYSLTVAAPGKEVPWPMLLSEAHIAVAPLGDRLRLAGILELSGSDITVSPARAESLRHAAEDYLPGLADATTLEAWSGLRPCTPDSLPYLGRAHPYRNVWFACGGGHIGMGVAPACGDLLAAAMTGARPESSLDRFQLRRWG